MRTEDAIVPDESSGVLGIGHRTKRVDGMWNHMGGSRKSRGRSKKPQTRNMGRKCTDEQDVMSGLEEVRRGRGSAGLVRGAEDRCETDESNGKEKGKGNGGKG